MWGRFWSNLYSLMIPYPNKPNLQPTPEKMEAQNLTVENMFKTTEKFYTDLGFEPLFDSFWNHSLFRKPTDGRVVKCHATAWDFNNGEVWITTFRLIAWTFQTRRTFRLFLFRIFELKCAVQIILSGIFWPFITRWDTPSTRCNIGIYPINSVEVPITASTKPLASWWPWMQPLPPTCTNLVWLMNSLTTRKVTSISCWVRAWSQFPPCRSTLSTICGVGEFSAGNFPKTNGMTSSGNWNVKWWGFTRPSHEHLRILTHPLCSTSTKTTRWWGKRILFLLIRGLAANVFPDTLHEPFSNSNLRRSCVELRDTRVHCINVVLPDRRQQERNWVNCCVWAAVFLGRRPWNNLQAPRRCLSNPFWNSFSPCTNGWRRRISKMETL